MSKRKSTTQSLVGSKLNDDELIRQMIDISELQREFEAENERWIKEDMMPAVAEWLVLYGIEWVPYADIPRGMKFKLGHVVSAGLLERQDPSVLDSMGMFRHRLTPLALQKIKEMNDGNV